MSMEQITSSHASSLSTYFRLGYMVFADTYLGNAKSYVILSLIDGCLAWPTRCRNKLVLRVVTGQRKSDREEAKTTQEEIISD